jgi:hypothetical protein
VEREPKTVEHDCRGVATRLERLAKEHFDSNDKVPSMRKAARVLRRAAEKSDPRERVVFAPLRITLWRSAIQSRGAEAAALNHINSSCLCGGLSLEIINLLLHLRNARELRLKLTTNVFDKSET